MILKPYIIYEHFFSINIFRVNNFPFNLLWKLKKKKLLGKKNEKKIPIVCIVPIVINS